MVQQVELLGRVLADAVHVDRRDGMVLVDRQVTRLAEDLARRRVDDDRVRILATHEIEEGELTRRVDLEVEHGVAHRIDVTHLAREIEHELGRHCRVTDVGALDVTDVGLDHSYRRVRVALGVGDQIAAIRAMARDERIDHRHLGAPASERQSKVGADEAEPTGDEAPAPRNDVTGHGFQTAASVRDDQGRARGGEHGRDPHLAVGHEPRRELGAVVLPHFADQVDGHAALHRAAELHLRPTDDEAGSPRHELILDRFEVPRVVHVVEHVEVAVA